MQSLSILEVVVRCGFAFATGALSLMFAFASGPDYSWLLSWSAGLAAIHAVFVRPLFYEPRRGVRLAAWTLATPLSLGLLFNGERFISVIGKRVFG